MKTFLLVIQLLLAILCSTLALGVSATPQEFSEANRWAAAKFEGIPETKRAVGYLMVYLKAGQVGKNQVSTQGYGIYATGTSPLQVADKEYRQGLHCPSEGRVVVHLPAPGKDFEAIVGVDSNQVKGFYSNAGRGSVIATVEVGGKEVFRSGVMHEGMPGRPVKVNLNGATDFALGLNDAGGGTVQGVDFNQADWAEARVTLTDRSTVQLGDLPTGPMRSAYTTDPPFSFRYEDQPSTQLLKNFGTETRCPPAGRESDRAHFNLFRSKNRARGAMCGRGYTEISLRWNGRCTSRIQATIQRRSWKTSKRWTSDWSATMTVNSCCITAREVLIPA